jgi:hypothetical protein
MLCLSCGASSGTKRKGVRCRSSGYQKFREDPGDWKDKARAVVNSRLSETSAALELIVVTCLSTRYIRLPIQTWQYMESVLTLAFATENISMLVLFLAFHGTGSVHLVQCTSCP